MKKIHRIGIDLGGTKTESILLDPEGAELFRKRTATPRDEGYSAILENVISMILEARARIGTHSAPFALGMGIPGIIDEESGVVQNANTTVMIGHPLRQDLESKLGRSIRIENDANCFTIAEARSGAARGYGFVFGVIMGTGCGGGVYYGDTVRHGPHGIAGEWGHFSFDPAGDPCWCGNRGCIETAISGSGVEHKHTARTGTRLSMQSIVEGYRNGDAECTKTVEQFLEDYGRALGGLISILDPDAVVLGGGLSNIPELYTIGMERIRKYVFHRSLRTPILKNAMGDSAGVFGAAWIGIEE